jgi:hypothetical protein
MLRDILTLPYFLKRKNKRGRPRKVVADTMDNKSILNGHEEWNKIKKEKYGAQYTVMLKDEAPRIGSGLRTVYVKEGRKWAFVIQHSGDPKNTVRKVRVRMLLKKWQGIKENSFMYFKRNDVNEIKKRLSRKRYK